MSQWFSRWNYRLSTGENGTVEISPEGNKREDEMMARYMVRKKLGLVRLPVGSKVYPDLGPHGKPLIDIL